MNVAKLLFACTPRYILVQILGSASLDKLEALHNERELLPRKSCTDEALFVTTLVSNEL